MAGAVAISILRFTSGGWTIAANAEKKAQTGAKEEVILAMVLVCLNASEADPQRAAKLETLNVSSSFGRSNAVMETGWAAFPGSDGQKRDLATACVEGLKLDGS